MSLSSANEPASRSWGHASRFKHPATGLYMAKVMPGFYYLTADDEMINTVLGSCVCACIRDPIAKIGGMNHYMLPGNSGDYSDTVISNTGAANRYGQNAMDNLIAELIAQGCRKSNFEIKLFGGGNVMNSGTRVGDQNTQFAIKYCNNHGLNITSSDFGDTYPRKVNYSPMTGKVKMMKLRGAFTGLVSKNEPQAVR